MYKLYCSDCENRFTISDEIFNNFLEDDNALMKCPNCQSIEVNILEVEGQRAGY
jgi:Zn finger protein HypA/HybF involved in hydrogenase expression